MMLNFNAFDENLSRLLIKKFPPKKTECEKLICGKYETNALKVSYRGQDVVDETSLTRYRGRYCGRDVMDEILCKTS